MAPQVRSPQVKIAPRPQLPPSVRRHIQELKRASKAEAQAKRHRIGRYSEQGGYRETWVAFCQRERCWGMIVVLGPLGDEDVRAGGTALAFKCGPHKSPIRI